MLSPSLRKIAPKKVNEDVAVPVTRLPELIAGLTELSRQHGIKIVNFGHAGNGNIHVNLLADPDDAAQMSAIMECLRAVFRLVLSLDVAGHYARPDCLSLSVRGDRLG